MDLVPWVLKIVLRALVYRKLSCATILSNFFDLNVTTFSYTNLSLSGRILFDPTHEAFGILNHKIHMFFAEGTYKDMVIFIILLLSFSSHISKGKVKHELRVPSYEFKYTSYEFKLTSQEFQSTSYEFQLSATSSKPRVRISNP